MEVAVAEKIASSFDWTAVIQGVLEGGTTGNLVKGGLLLVIGIVMFFFKTWIKKQKIKAARAKTQKQRQENQTTIETETTTISQDAQNSENRVEDIINGD